MDPRLAWRVEAAVPAGADGVDGVESAHRAAEAQASRAPGGSSGDDRNGVFVPHGTPAAIVQKLNAGLNKALVSPLVSTRFAELNIESRQNTPAEFGAYVEAQMVLWSRVVKEAGIRLG